MKVPYQNIPSSQREHICSFGGYDKREKSGGVTFTEMENMTGKYSPLLSVRDSRSILNTGDAHIIDIKSMDFRKTGSTPKLIKNALLADCGDRLIAFYDDGDGFSSHAVMNTSQFLSEDGRSSVLGGSKLCFFPDAKTIDIMDSGSSDLNCSSEIHLGAYEGYYYEWKMTPCDVDGNETEESSAFCAVTRPYYRLQNGAKGEYLGLMSFNSGFADGDAVKISGLTSPSLNGLYYNILRSDRVNRKLILEFPADHLQDSGTVYISRTVPQMDFVISAGNRLWGCRYGVDTEGSSINEIYASALGDFTNWRRYGGISTDSWTASVGAPGAFTGAVAFNGHPVFFKEDCIIKVFGDYPAEFTLTESHVRGVEAGSEKSIAIVNDTLYYKSYSGIVRYDGGIPKNADAALGHVKYKNAVAGAAGSDYYVSMEDEDGKYHLFVYSSDKNVWHREDGARALCFCRCGAELFMLCGDGRIYCVNGHLPSSAAAEEDVFPWYCVTGSIGFEKPDHKYVSSLSLRIEAGRRAEADVMIEYDRDGIWHKSTSVCTEGDTSVTVPVIPRRCDSFRIKLCGKGDVKIRSVTVVLEDSAG